MTDSQIETSTPMRSMWVIVDPEMAARWLEGNRNNRNLRKSVVTRYAKDMRAGAWTPSNDAVCISPEGRALNGQHRLSAIVTSGCCVGMFVITGMPEEAYANMDRGTGRTYADALRSRGVGGQAVALASTLSRACSFEISTANAVIAFDRGTSRVWSTRSGGLDVTDADRSRYLLAHPEISYSVSMWGTATTSKSTGGCPVSILALAHHLIERVAGRENADRFMHQLTTQDREPATGTIRCAVRALTTANGTRNTVADDRRLAIVLLAWNHWAAGNEITLVRLNENFRSSLPKISSRVSRNG